MSALDTFRQETRSWLDANCPESMRGPDLTGQFTYWGGRNASFVNDDQRAWFERMVEKQWTVPYWPKEYGGGGLDTDETRIFNEEMTSLGCRAPVVGFGIWMLGPVLLKYGTEAQKKKHVTDITYGRVRWCQGYSEPGAGSDLASLRTEAVSDGDDYIVSGSKIWTSYADHADAIFCMVRTSTDSKHGGVSFLMIDDMQVEGIQTSPIKLISGASPFCETYFESVRVPKVNRIGEENQGWEVGMYLLQHERVNISTGLVGAGEDIVEVAIDGVGLRDNKLADPVLRKQLAQLQMRQESIRFTGQRARDEAGAGRTMGHASAALKYSSAEWNKTKNELIMNLSGFAGLGWEGEDSSDGFRARSWLRTKANSIEGGTSEIQLNIISKRILELPKN